MEKGVGDIPFLGTFCCGDVVIARLGRDRYSTDSCDVAVRCTRTAELPATCLITAMKSPAVICLIRTGGSISVQAAFSSVHVFNYAHPVSV